MRADIFSYIFCLYENIEISSDRFVIHILKNVCEKFERNMTGTFCLKVIFVHFFFQKCFFEKMTLNFKKFHVKIAFISMVLFCKDRWLSRDVFKHRMTILIILSVFYKLFVENELHVWKRWYFIVVRYPKTLKIYI